MLSLYTGQVIIDKSNEEIRVTKLVKRHTKWGDIVAQIEGRSLADGSMRHVDYVHIQLGFNNLPLLPFGAPESCGMQSH
jgi:hypothetical protein